MSAFDCWKQEIGHEKLEEILHALMERNDFDYTDLFEDAYKVILKSANQGEKKFLGLDFHWKFNGFKSPPRTIKPISVRLKK